MSFDNNDDKPFDHAIHDLMSSQFGRRKGGLWRSERDWFCLASKDPQGVLKKTKMYTEDRRQGLYDEKGFSRSRNHRWMGSIPSEVVWANPELLYDPEAVRKFFADFPVYSSKGK